LLQQIKTKRLGISVAKTSVMELDGMMLTAMERLIGVAPGVAEPWKTRGECMGGKLSHLANFARRGLNGDVFFSSTNTSTL
jgi:hypothetical protein